uniref:NADH-ubiquinone oxidoreductase chain 5 n=1 Tax=Hildenbrandia rubra TaxID=31481 RepID=A0A0A7A6T7_9FLOR|nr:NADH dehydrogenase subunit 5 [Hildenbrandia rubra]AHB62140.1 NADH dehydrogenase subunit 5 [Hildenbrandia rubra]
MYLLTVALPLLGSLSSGLLGRLLGQKGTNFVSCFCMGICFICCGFSFYEIGFLGSLCSLNGATWINSGQYKVFWGFLFDSLTTTMLVIVTFISSLVHVYSIKYMENDPHSPRFMSYLGIFTFFMIFLVSADNIIQMFVGWEGVGLASYLLINFWYTRLPANQSAIKALIVNRVGDFGLLISALLVFYMFQSVDYSTIFSIVPLLTKKTFVFFSYQLNSLNLIGIFLCIGAFGKSAQLGLHSWLPDAMEGPTPVSALIHAATMVTAGVFLIIRFSPLIEYTPIVLFTLVIVGSLTAFFAATAGAFQSDIKKIIAYSTCSQLGYMIFVCGISHYQASIFHLANHAFFKALLFLSAGSVIHALNDEQDIRKMGALRYFMPLTYSLTIIGSLALVGFPFLTGFYSKDFILELLQISHYTNLNKTYGLFAYWLGVTSVFFTAFYSFRLIYMTFLNSTNLSRVYFNKIHDSCFLMLSPLIFLAIGSIFIGFLSKDLFIGLGTDFWKSSIFSLPKELTFFEAELIPLQKKWLPFLITLLGFFTAASLNSYSNNFHQLFSKLIFFVHPLLFSLNKKWYFDNVYNQVFVVPLLQFGYRSSFQNLDKGFIELLGPYGLPRIVRTSSKNWSLLQTGQITHYLFFILLGLLVSFFTYNFNTSLLIFYDNYLLVLNFLYLGIFYPNKNF